MTKEEELKTETAADDDKTLADVDAENIRVETNQQLPKVSSY